MKQLKISILMLLVFTILAGVIYPALITGVGRILFKAKIYGSLVMKDGTAKGSIQAVPKFDKPEFFEGRPSAVNYDAAGSGGSNMGPTNKKLIDGVKAGADLIRKDFNISDKTALPSDFIFASTSGLDPHISLEAVKLQTGRIADVRKIDKSVIADIVKLNSERQLRIYGSSYVNVLKLNLALIDKGEQND